MLITNGKWVNVHSSEIIPGTDVAIKAGRFAAVGPDLGYTKGEATQVIDAGGRYLVPGLCDAHMHVESGMVTVTEFARAVIPHGTTSMFIDPHEIANVLGLDGVRWMLANAAQTPFHVLFGAPSCVPATAFETAGARLGVADVETLLATPGIGYLSEVMNFPGVLAGDPGLLAMIAAARRRGLPVDGHAPGLSGEAAAAYAAAGIGTDHECATLAEAEDKLRAGMAILIREGSAARNFETLHPLISRYPGRIMLCTDDCHPDDLARGHIDRLVARAIAHGHDLFAMLEADCLTPQRHYGLALGQLRVGDPFNAALVDNLSNFTVRATWLAGELAAENGQSCLPPVPCQPINRFAARAVRPEELCVAPSDADFSRVIAAEDGQLLTRELRLPLHGPSVADDVLLIAVVNRYTPTAPAVALVRGFGLQAGALASSVAHDSHNVIGVGCDAASLATALNAVIAVQGGLALVDGDGQVDCLPLPIAGLMSDLAGDTVASRYAALSHGVRHRLGSPLRAPYMTLSFMALLVIPELKLSDRGLFDGRAFALTEVACPA